MVLSVNVFVKVFFKIKQNQSKSKNFRPDKNLVSNIMPRRSGTIENRLSPKALCVNHSSNDMTLNFKLDTIRSIWIILGLNKRLVYP